MYKGELDPLEVSGGFGMGMSSVGNTSMGRLSRQSSVAGLDSTGKSIFSAVTGMKRSHNTLYSNACNRRSFATSVHRSGNKISHTANVTSQQFVFVHDSESQPIGTVGSSSSQYGWTADQTSRDGFSRESHSNSRQDTYSSSLFAKLNNSAVRGKKSARTK